MSVVYDRICESAGGDIAVALMRYLLLVLVLRGEG